MILVNDLTVVIEDYWGVLDVTVFLSSVVFRLRGWRSWELNNHQSYPKPEASCSCFMNSKNEIHRE